MSCIKCRLRRWYYAILKCLMFPVRRLAGGINIEDQVTAVLIKDGKVIKRIVGIKMHNKWKVDAVNGLANIANVLKDGGSGTTPCKVHTMSLGSQCSDTAFTLIADTDETTENSVIGAQAEFWATWIAAGAISNICQAMIEMSKWTGDGTVDAAIYNFGTTFVKPDGVSLKIEWTTTLTS